MQAKIKVFDIINFGFYPYRSMAPNFGSSGSILNQLAIWATEADRSTINTHTTESAANEPITRSYFYDYYSRNDNHILILWHEYQNADGSILGLNGNGRPGDSETRSSTFEGEDYIPGLPGYYWFNSSLNVCISVDFNSSCSKKTLIERYIKGFIQNRWPYKITNEHGEIINYAEDERLVVNRKSFPKFKLSLMKNTAVEEELFIKRERITRMIKEEKLETQLQDQRSTIEKMFSGLLRNTPVYLYEKTFKHEFEFTPTEAELVEIIDSFRSQDDNGNIENIGFRAEGRVYMLSGINVQFTQELNLFGNQDGVITAVDLHDEIIRLIPAILDEINRAPRVVIAEDIEDDLEMLNE